jgi:hypothetical protein
MKRKRDTFTVAFTRAEAERINLLAKARGMTPEALIEELMEDAVEELRAELAKRIYRNAAQYTDRASPSYRRYSGSVVWRLSVTHERGPREAGGGAPSGACGRPAHASGCQLPKKLPLSYARSASVGIFHR